MRVVIDTNVIVSGLRSTRGAAFCVLRGVRDGVVKPIVSPALFFEYEDVLSRPGMIPGQMSSMVVSAFLDAFLLMAETRDVFFRWRPWLPDPKDECVLELAVAAGYVPITTCNVRDFQPASALGVRVMTPWGLSLELKLK
ncbi:MAG: putative toxin-antitoxin system toxin component, PIN family [Verrucomicrobiales bacterium]|nr:putative toxin-antitoxin system toxin component, PIN family [Verrucomicrobiales bacterium]